MSKQLTESLHKHNMNETNYLEDVKVKYNYETSECKVIRDNWIEALPEGWLDYIQECINKKLKKALNQVTTTKHKTKQIIPYLAEKIYQDPDFEGIEPNDFIEGFKYCMLKIAINCDLELLVKNNKPKIIATLIYGMMLRKQDNPECEFTFRVYKKELIEKEDNPN